MIQRIQTIFLLLAAGALAAMTWLPFTTSGTMTDGVQTLFADGMYSIADSPVLLGLGYGGVLLAVVAIFLFRNRKLQVRLGYVIILVCLGVLGVAYWVFASHSSDVQELHQSFGWLMPVIAAICVLLANRNIQKDEKLVHSADRLR